MFVESGHVREPIAESLLFGLVFRREVAGWVIYVDGRDVVMLEVNFEVVEVRLKELTHERGLYHGKSRE